MRRIVFALSITLPLLGAACGDDDTLPEVCTVDSDCPVENPVCDFRNGQCTNGCNEAADCGGNYPTCNDDGANTLAPSVCICSAASCAAGQACLPDGTCGTPTSCGMAGEQGSCTEGQICQSDGTCADTCGEAGTVGNCEAGEVCMPSGDCAAACDNGDGTTGCLATLSLCDTSTQSMTFNGCVAPQQVTGGCANAANHTRAAEGGVIVDVAYQGDIPPETNNCGAGNVQSFAVDFYSPDGVASSFYSNGIKRLDPDTTASLVYSDGPNTSTHPVVTPVDGSPGRYTITFTMCLSQAQMMQQLAVFINDSDSDASNAACFLAR